MKKYQYDYFREIEKFSKQCLKESEIISSVINRKKNIILQDDTTGTLQYLTEKLRTEYFTPIEREDIYLLASIIHRLNISLKMLCKTLKEKNVFSSEIKLISDNIHSALQENNNCINHIIKNDKTNTYNSAFKSMKTAEKGLLLCKSSDYSNYTETNFLTEKCLWLCIEFSDAIIYTQIKNS